MLPRLGSLRSPERVRYATRGRRREGCVCDLARVCCSRRKLRWLEHIEGQWVLQTKGPYEGGHYDTTATENYGEYGDENEDDDDDAKTGTATPESLGLGPDQHFQIFTTGRDGQDATPTPVTGRLSGSVAAASGAAATRKRVEPGEERGPPTSPPRPAKKPTSK